MKGPTVNQTTSSDADVPDRSSGIASFGGSLPTTSQRASDHDATVSTGHVGVHPPDAAPPPRRGRPHNPLRLPPGQRRLGQ